MSGHLVDAGHSVVIWNRTAEKAAPYAAKGAKVASNLSELAAQCDLIFLCVSRSEDVKSCLDTMMPTAKPGTLFVDHSTISPDAALEFHKLLSSNGFRFIDAPITGGSMGAQKGQLTIFCGGTEEDCAEVMPYLQAYAKKAERVGEAGAGEMMKMANQIAVGGALLALCESLSFAKKAGLDIAQVRALVGSGAGGSWAFENYGLQILNSDWRPGFSIKNQLKDFGYCRAAASEIDAAIPLTELVEKLLQLLADEGKEELTTAALYETMLEMGA